MALLEIEEASSPHPKNPQNQAASHPSTLKSSRRSARTENNRPTPSREIAGGTGSKWDALNRLISITYPSGDSSSFTYDGLSRRVQIIEKNTSGTVTSTKNDVWCGSSMCEERDASNNVTKRFYDQGEQQNGTPYYYTRDHIGSIRELMSSSGSIVARYSYDMYGRTTLVSGTNLATRQFTGDYYHAASGLNLTMYRAYDQNTGRWLSRDPISENDGSNIYEYVGNDPADSTDPLGLAGCKVEIRCGVVAFGFRHCGLYVNGVEYGLGGDGNMPDRPNGKGAGDGATLFGGGGGIPKPYANPAPQQAEAGITTYTATCTCSCDAVAKCFQNYQNTVTPPRYAAISGPNSNTYAHNMFMLG